MKKIEARKKSKPKEVSKTTAIDRLAILVVNGFNDMEKRFEGIEKRFEGIDKRFEGIDKKFEGIDQRFEIVNQELEHINARLSYMEKDITEIKEKVIPKDDFDDLESRVKYCEIKLKIDSGK